MSLDEHITDDDLERYCVDQITAESELAALEEHILACPECAVRARLMHGYVGSIRAALADAGSVMVSKFGVEPERIWLDFFAEESIGNLLFIRSLLQRPRVSSLLIVSEASHGQRLKEHARHLYPGLITQVFPVPSSPTVDIERACTDNSTESLAYQARFVRDVPVGDGDAAIRWLEENHPRHPYKDIRSLNEVSIPPLDEIDWITEA